MREYGVIGGIKTYQVQTAVLGTGAAGYNAACLLKKGGADDLVIITESRNAGTSRNTGSDKQTYYKLSLAGDNPDSVFLQYLNAIFMFIFAKNVLKWAVEIQQINRRQRHA